MYWQLIICNLSISDDAPKVSVYSIFAIRLSVELLFLLIDEIIISVMLLFFLQMITSCSSYFSWFVYTIYLLS
jgi:hypothetical protein